jgi:transposase-like protein
MEKEVWSGKVPRRFDEAFRRQAVEMVLHGGKTVSEVAREVGVSSYSIYEWKRKYFAKGLLAENAASGQEDLPKDLEALRQLALEQARRLERQQRQIADLVQQREILKKTLGIVCDKPGNATNG